MKILFDRPIIASEKKYIVIENDIITYIGTDKPDGEFDRIISGDNKMMMPGLYNCHTHVPMTLFRGYAEDLPLHEWLHEKIFPAEELLTEKSVYISSKFAMAEMIKNGVISFTDMYSFSDKIADAAIETGMKANIGRAFLCFDPTLKLKDDFRFREAEDLFKNYHNTADGRIKIDMSVHAEYTNLFGFVKETAEYTKEIGANMHVHISETISEHNECIERNGMTPTEFFYRAGLFESTTLAAHCVHVTDSDMDIMSEKGVSVAHNPVSNLKLGSGVMRLPTMLEKGINVTFGTDGCASNNTLDILKEMYIAAILHKGVNLKPDIIPVGDIIKMATENGALSQRRELCGKIEVDHKADIILLDMNDVNMIPLYDTDSALYSINSSNVCMTMVDGKILYENGEFTTLDIEKIKHDMREICAATYHAKG
jgi:Cytosine deaminase and related metal-dependent hydrolases